MIVSLLSFVRRRATPIHTGISGVFQWTAIRYPSGSFDDPHETLEHSVTYRGLAQIDTNPEENIPLVLTIDSATTKGQDIIRKLLPHNPGSNKYRITINIEPIR